MDSILQLRMLSIQICSKWMFLLDLAVSQLLPITTLTLLLNILPKNYNFWLQTASTLSNFPVSSFKPSTAHIMLPICLYQLKIAIVPVQKGLSKTKRAWNASHVRMTAWPVHQAVSVYLAVQLIFGPLTTFQVDAFLSMVTMTMGQTLLLLWSVLRTAWLAKMAILANLAQKTFF